MVVISIALPYWRTRQQRRAAAREQASGVV
jgi:hypothetical protein